MTLVRQGVGMVLAACIAISAGKQGVGVERAQ